MVPTQRAVLQIVFFILCTINGLHSLPKNHPSLGILNELIGQDSKSPLIVVVDSNNQAITLNDDEPDQRQKGRGHIHSNSFHGDHNHNPAHIHDDNHVHSNSVQSPNQQYEAALLELLRTSRNMLAMERQNKIKNGKNGKKPNDKDCNQNSCNNDDTQFLAEQCSKSENSCSDDAEKETC